MKKIKIFFIAIIIISMCYSQIAFTQETVSSPTKIVQSDVTIVEEQVPYVKPGHVTVNFKDADINAVLSYLSEVSAVDIVTSPDVTGTVNP